MVCSRYHGEIKVMCCTFWAVFKMCDIFVAQPRGYHRPEKKLCSKQSYNANNNIKSDYKLRRCLRNC